MSAELSHKVFSTDWQSLYCWGS